MKNRGHYETTGGVDPRRPSDFSKKKEWRHWGTFVRGIAIGLILAGAPPAATAQSTVQDHVMLDGSTVESAGSILNQHPVGGRFGTSLQGGYISPTPNKGRIGSGGFLYTPDGQFLGFDTNTPNSRFQAYWEQTPGTLPSEANADLLEARQLRNAWNRDLADQQAAETPRQVGAIRPTPFPERRAEDRTGVVEAFPERSEPTAEPFRSPAQEVWMRGGPRNDSASSGNRSAETGISGETRISAGFPVSAGAYITPPSRQASPADLGSQFVGGALPVDNNPLPTSFIPITPARPSNPVAELQEYLELSLLRSPTVNPLSPIQVIFSNGRATVRGIVPTEQNRMEAGRILLTDPRVKSVDNKLTVVPNDINTPVPQAFDPNAPSAPPEPTAPNAANPSNSVPANPPKPASAGEKNGQ